MGEPRETHMKGKRCDICGAVGYEEAIRICSQCMIQRHIYCMPVVDKDMPKKWVCEVCLAKNSTGSFKSGQKEDVQDSSREVCHDLGRQVESKRQKAVETGKVKFLPTDEVIKLSSGTSKREISLKSYFRSNPVPNFTTSLSKRSLMGSEADDPIKVKRNPSFLQLGSVNPPRRGVHSSSIPQHAVTAPKESKGQNFHLAVEYENSDVVAERETWNGLNISLYRPYLPALYSTWTGGFKFLDTATLGEFCDGFLAQPPCRVHRKAYELSQKMPRVLHVNMLQQCQLQADLFLNGCLDLCDIALYFFPLDIERSQNYKRLFQLMADKNSVMISYVDSVQLLIFTSKQLPADSRDVFTGSSRDFFGGVFRHAKDNQVKVHQKLPSFASHLEYTHDNANMSSSEVVDMVIDMVGGKTVGIPGIAFSKESTQEFNKWDRKETLDATRNERFSSASGDLNPMIEPTSLESEREYCKDSDLQLTGTEKIKSKLKIGTVEHPLESSLGRFPGSTGEIGVPPGFKGGKKPDPNDRAPNPKAPSVEEKIDLGKRQIMSRVKEEIGCQGNLQVAYGVGRPQSYTEDASLRGSRKQQKVLADHLINDPSAACSPPSCLIGERSKFVSVKIEGNDSEKPFQRLEKKGLQDPSFLRKDDSQTVGPCAVKVKAKVQGLVNDPSSVCPRLLDKETKIVPLNKTQEYGKEKPDERRGKKGLEAGSSDGPCSVVDKAKTQKVKQEANTSHSLHTTLPSAMNGSLLSGPSASARVRLSVAGRSSGNLGPASAGGLIRDESGGWIRGYRVNLGRYSSLAADLWALFQGIKFTWDIGYRKVLVESDSAAAVESLKNAPSLLNSNKVLIEHCRSLLNGEWDCKVVAIQSEANLCATWLATPVEGQPVEIGLSIVKSPPSELIPLLEHDSIRVCSCS